MKKASGLLYAMALVGIVVACSKDDDPSIKKSSQTFSCKIGNDSFAANALSLKVCNWGNDMVPYAKGIVVSDGTAPAIGNIRMTINLGTNNLGEPTVGSHTIAASLSGATGFDNRGLATFQDVSINGMTCFPAAGKGNVYVEKYYRDDEQGFKGGKGTFDHIKLYFVNMTTFEMDSIMITDGVFDFQSNLP
jgi:hypothetical protein